MTDCFTCPQPANYAAVALQLQKTALDAEACIFALEKRLRGAVNLPTMVYTSTSGVGPIPANIRTEITVIGTATFVNSPLLSTFTNPLPRGIYQAGIFANLVASGAVNDNTYRILEVAARDSLAASSTPDTFQAVRTTYETNGGGGMDTGLTTVLTSDGNTVVKFWLTHGNTGSGLNVPVGAIFWVTKLSDLDAVRVVA